jgi:hypothetical protein
MVETMGTAGMRDLLVREPGGDGLSVRFRWNAEAHGHKPVVDGELRKAVERACPP